MLRVVRDNDGDLRELFWDNGLCAGVDGIDRNSVCSSRKGGLTVGRIVESIMPATSGLLGRDVVDIIVADTDLPSSELGLQFIEQTASTVNVSQFL